MDDIIIPMSIQHKQIQTINEFIDAIRIRVDVFIIEQGCPPGWEPAEEDKISEHYIALVDDEIVATVRLREYSQDVAKIETMVVKKEHRREGIGISLTRYVMEQARRQGYKKIFMQAQVQAKGVYEKAGFKVASQPYNLWNLGIPHVDMEYIFE